MSLTAAEKQALTDGMFRLFDLSIKIPLCLNNFRAGICSNDCSWVQFCVITTRQKEARK